MHGRVDFRAGEAMLISPRLFLTAPKGLIPIYRDLAGISRGRIRNLIRQALNSVSEFPEALPLWIRENRSLSALDESIRTIHNPDVEEPGKLVTALEPFRYLEFLKFHLELRLVRHHLKNISRRFRYSISKEFFADLTNRLKFSLTEDQEAAVSDIARDLTGETTMQRLIQGDVGAGKTAVAFSAMLMAARNGFQAAFLAPTELLAHQHEEKAREFFSGFSVAVLTGSTPREERQRIETEIQKGRLQLVFGTHALLSAKLEFRNLAMIVIDEQQRFGVSQRAALYCKGPGADLIVTTATPIPRTLLLTLYNDLSVSTIRSRPHGRRQVKTRVLGADKREEFYTWLEKHLAQTPGGGRVFIILPRIHPSDSGNRISSLDVEGEELSQRFSDQGIAILSSETPADKRQRILKLFHVGEIRILVCTTVIELGIDVPEADTMVIENADRFGLAQLHQLRGRIGRSGASGYCYLMQSENPTQMGVKRLGIVSSEEDGFRLAEMDLQIRGGGEVAGFRQAGSLDFRFGDPVRDHRIFIQAREDSKQVLGNPERCSPLLRNFILSVRRKMDRLHFS